MNEETIVAVYDTAADAEAAVHELEAAHVPSSAITRRSGGAPQGNGVAPVRERGFWSDLFGGEPDHDDEVYNRSIDTGSSVITVKVGADHAGHVTDILERHHPVDIDERAAGYGLTAQRTAPTMPTAAPAAHANAMAGGTETLKLAEEQINVGKRRINRGTTRIRRFVVETPVSENVSLHAERVTIERRPVSGTAAVGAADFADRTIEVTETDEEAVVSKTTRVREEVVVRKEATDRVETIHDTVRHEDVEITKDGVAQKGAPVGAAALNR